MAIIFAKNVIGGLTVTVYCVIFFLQKFFAKLKFSEMQGRHTAIESIHKNAAETRLVWAFAAFES